MNRSVFLIAMIPGITVGGALIYLGADWPLLLGCAVLSGIFGGVAARILQR